MQLCVRIAKEGLHVLVAGHTQSKLDAVADLIKDQRRQRRAVIADATDEVATKELFARAGDNLV